ncbi:nuclear pore complex protein NUP214 isoform X2 [Mercurialis annua]|uniref:nuclear pore complex protein NUP214 isoform X2 n=1 Tax=Mercurialis annua TaxID=3986 RepID=UPI0021606318|nr:nuclear pore complex protein NUP214 isoform X2 [Mercurialis annua]
MGAVKEIELEEEEEGERAFSDDYFFDGIGKPIPILKPIPNAPSLFSDYCPGSPIAVSQLHRLLFVAHPSGFYVARTKDVMDQTDGGSSVQELSIADVPIAKLHILSLSSDDSTLAAAVDAHVHFFRIHSLLNQQLNPFFSCSLPQQATAEFCFVKDFKWRRRPAAAAAASYILLSNQRSLYHAAALSSPLQHLMDNVDAVEWSFDGTYISVAKQNVLHILSSKFKQILCISLPFNSWTADSPDESTVKVDSIRWVRPDSIVIGCFQQTADGKEENYRIQVLRSKDGKIADASSKVSVLSYYDLFSGLIDDILPYGNGPYLLLSYLEQCGLAITANKKNTDQHIMLLRWSVEDDMSETTIVDFDRDTWIPRIHLQGNGDDNLIMGLCVDYVSLYKKVKVEVGLQKRELSPSCVLFCVTLEGNLVMFYVASAAEPTTSFENEYTLTDEEEDSDLPAVSVECNLPFGLEKTDFSLQLKEASDREPDIIKGSEHPTKKDLMPSGNSKSSMTAEQISPKDASTEGAEMETVVNIKPSVSDGQEKAFVTKMFLGVDGQQVESLKNQSINMTQFSLKNSPQEGTSCFVNRSSETENKKYSEFRPAPAFFENAPSVPSQLNSKDVVHQPKDSRVSFGSTGLQGAQSEPWLSEKVTFSGGPESRSSTTASALVQGHTSDKIGVSVGTGNFPGAFAGKPLYLSDSVGNIPSADFSVGPAQNVGQKASVKTGMIDSLPSIRSSQLPPQDFLTFGRSASHWPSTSKDARKLSSPSNSEPYLSRQFGNIKEMDKELDSLLECIEEPGGFKDACLVSQMGSVEALEDRMEMLFGKCRMWKSMMDEQLGEVQHLLDKTVQVLAKKIYIDGIVKQASDSRYWDLWNHQKLGSELELKRHNILKLNQVLTDQIIQLERHFNTLELHKFDENGGVYKGRRASQSRYGPSRQIQSLHSLHNTTNLQVAAAEQLSECLSKQMAVLSIESPVKQKNVKKELFETIGIQYDPVFSSPDSTKVGNSSSQKILLSGSASNRSQSRRRHSSAIKSSDSETVRRIRDSLDQSWVNFEPTKTTVKRVLLQETQKTSVNRRQVDSPGVVRSAVSHLKDLTSPSTLVSQSGHKGIQHTLYKQAFEAKSTPSKWSNESLVPSQSTYQGMGLRTPFMESNDDVQPSISPFRASPMTRQILASETSNVMADKLSGSSSTRNSDSVFINESKSILLFEERAALSNSGIQSSNSGPTNEKGVSSLPGKAPQLSIAASGSQPSEKTSFSQASLMPLSSATSPAVNSSTKFATFGSNLSSIAPSLSAIRSKTKVDVNEAVSSPAFPCNSSLQAPRSLLPLHTPPAVSVLCKTELQSASGKMPPHVNPTLPSISEPGKTEAQLPLAPSASQWQPLPEKLKSSTDADTSTAAPKAQPEIPTFSLKVELPESSVRETDTSTGSQSSLNSMASPKPPCDVFEESLASDSAANRKNTNSDFAITEEDEMEEEAPEVISLGSLGGFGLGSTPNSNAPRTNPFGASFGNIGTNQASSSFTMTPPSGELFKPASFSFQPLQPSQPSPPTNMGASPGGFGAKQVAQTPAPSAFGQPAQIGAGQQALGSVLGSFGQSRQFGTGSFPGAGSVGGFATTNAISGSSSAATSGGFAAAASTGGGFAGLASGTGGFGGFAGGGLGSGGGGFPNPSSGNGSFGGAAGGGFAAAGGGFGAFNSQQGSGGFSSFSGNTAGNQPGIGSFSAFGGSTGGTGKPSELFTQMRK